MLEELNPNQWYEIEYTDYEVFNHNENGISLRIWGEIFVYVPWNRAESYLEGFTSALLGKQAPSFAPVTEEKL